MKEKLIIWLPDIGKNDFIAVGGKGFNLGEMARHLRVPPGFCLNSAAYIKNLNYDDTHKKIKKIVENINIKDIETIDKASAKIYDLITGLDLLPEIVEAITNNYNQLSINKPDLKVAVRSSATAEDLEDASFAGQQETYLDVSGIDNILAAVKKCWASLWTSRAIHYRAQKGFDNDLVYMAVIIQEMLPAEVSGVMFTANPVSNSRQEVLIEATRGLGEALVSGTVTGDNYIITKDGIQIKSKTISDEKYGQLLPDEVIRDLALHGVKIERYYENYQDVEWGYYRGDLYFLQSRSITTLADEEPVVYQWDKLTNMQKEMFNHVAERYPEPIYPIDSVVVKITYSAYFKAMEKYGYFVPDMDWSRVEKGDFPEFFAPPRIRPGFPMRVLFPFKVFKALKTNPALEWHQERKYLLDILQNLAKRDVTNLPYDIVNSYVTEALNQFHYFIVLRYDYFVANRLPSDVLLRLLEFMFGAEADEIKRDLLAGIPCITTEINSSLRNLASDTMKMKEVSEYIKGGVFNDFRAVIANYPEGNTFFTLFDTFLEKYGDRETSMGLGGVASITWQEQPEVVLGMIRGMLLEDPKLEQARERKLNERIKNAEERLNKKLSSGLFRFIPKSIVTKLIKHSKSFDTFRENSHYDVTMSLKVFKILFVELGQRFHHQQLLDKPEDIFHLTYYEIKDIIFILFHKHKKLSIKALKTKIEQRKSDLVKRINRWKNRNNKIIADGDNVICGIPASTGTVTGTARIINNAREFHKIQPGDIMVAPYTNPAWTPLFTTAAGLVADTGGAASHAAIIAREYGIPAVMGAGSATTWLKDGDQITIDGSTGLIQKEKAL